MFVPPWLGLATTFHLLPFQRSVSVEDWGPPQKEVPVAQAFLLELALTPFSAASNPPGLGLGTWVQFVPFHRRVRVLVRLPSLYQPTAQASVPESALTDWSELPWVPPGPGLGLDGCVHEETFHRRTRVWSAVPSK